MSAWLEGPFQLENARPFECGDFTPEQCAIYQERWHFWWAADTVFGLSTVAFFMCAIGIFILGRLVTLIFPTERIGRHPLGRKVVSSLRYLSYRGFRVHWLQWNSAPVGVLLLGLAGTTYFFCMDLIPQPYYWPSLHWGGSPPLGTRSGWLGLACMPFVFATASKTSWITLLTGVSHERIQVFHRWIAYAFFILGLIHGFAFFVYHINNGNMTYQFTGPNIEEYWTGIAAWVAQAWLIFGSFGPIRKLGYEFFKAAHFTAVVAFVFFFFLHCAGTLTSWDYFVATAAIYVPCFAYAWMRTLFEYGRAQKAQLFVEENGFIRVTIPANFDWVPGQHCFLRFRSFGIHAFTSHPFTICSLPSTSRHESSNLVFYVRRMDGVTARLHRLATKQPGISVPVLVDGPYGGIDMRKFDSNDRLVVIAGGSGAGYCLSFIEQYARDCLAREIPGQTIHATNDVKIDPEYRLVESLRKSVSMVVVLVTRDALTRSWFERATRDILEAHGLKGMIDLEIQIYLTGDEPKQLEYSAKPSDDQEKSEKPIFEVSSVSQSTISGVSSKSTTSFEIVERHGRPCLPSIIQEEAIGIAGKHQSLGVYCCGPNEMQNDVRNAAASANLSILRTQRRGEVYLHSEYFSWA